MQIGNKIVFEKYIWRILDLENDAALIITEDIIEKRSYFFRSFGAERDGGVRPALWLKL